MAHARRQIREAVATALTGLTTTGSRVFQSRMREQESLPCLLVVTDTENVDASVGTIQQRDLDILVTGLALGASNVDDTLDAIAEEVETAVQAGGTLGGLVSVAPVLTGIRTQFDDSLQQPVGEIELAFRCTYFTHAGAPGTTV